MRVCFEHYKTLKPRPNLIIILTDGETPWPNEQPHGVQTIVVLVPSMHYLSNGTSPSWAKTIKIGEESNGS